jgi:hypothetical protein
MLDQPDARARCGRGRRQCDAVGHAGGKRVTRSRFGVRETETMTTDLVRGRAPGRGPQYEQA